MANDTHSKIQLDSNRGAIIASLYKHGFDGGNCGLVDLASHRYAGMLTRTFLLRVHQEFLDSEAMEVSPEDNRVPKKRGKSDV